MAFKDTYRLEKVYYENMWTLLRSLKALKENPSADEITKVNEILDDAIACNESIIIIYKNLGELYAEVAEKFADLLADLKALREDLEMWKNEINEKIDEVNNYLMGHIRDLDERVTSLEGRVSDLEERMTTAENDIDALEERMDTAESDIDSLEGRMDTAEGDIDALEGRMDGAEGDIDALEGRMDGAEDDIDDLEQNKQDKLTAGFGIEIDANNEISVDTNDVQEKLIAGQNITLTPDTTDPTKTVIDAQGGGDTFPLFDGQKTKTIINGSTVSLSSTLEEENETNVDKFNARSGMGSINTANLDTESDFFTLDLGSTGSRSSLASSDATENCSFLREVFGECNLEFTKPGSNSLTYKFKFSLVTVALKLSTYFHNASAGQSFILPVRQLYKNGYKLNQVQFNNCNCRAFINKGTVSATVYSDFKNSLNKITVTLKGETY